MRSVLDEMKARILEKNPNAFDEPKPKKSVPPAPTPKEPAEPRAYRTRTDRFDATSDAGSQPFAGRTGKGVDTGLTAPRPQPPAAEINKFEKSQPKPPLRRDWQGLRDSYDQSDEEEKYIKKFVEYSTSFEQDLLILTHRKNVMEEIREDVEREHVKKIVNSSKKAKQNDFKYVDPDQSGTDQPKKLAQALEQQVLQKLYERDEAQGRRRQADNRMLPVPVADPNQVLKEPLEKYASKETIQRLGLSLDDSGNLSGDPRNLVGQLGKEVLVEGLRAASGQVLRATGDGNAGLAGQQANIAQTLADQFLQIINATLGQVNQLVQKSQAVGVKYADAPGAAPVKEDKVRVMKTKGTSKHAPVETEVPEESDEEEKRDQVGSHPFAIDTKSNTAAILDRFNVTPSFLGQPYGTGRLSSQPQTNTFQLTATYEPPSASISNLGEYYKELGDDDQSASYVSASN
jgi:hypothetical protein